MAESFKSRSKILEGKLLISVPGCTGGGIFERSVVLIVRHEVEDGALGLILNRPSQQKVGDLIQDALLEPLAKLPVYVGGPVESERLSFAAMWTSEDGGFAFCRQISAEEAIVRDRQPGTLVRPFIGYSGWLAGQLEEELERKAWIVSEIPEGLLGMHHDRDLWAGTLRGMGPFHRVLAEFPDHPELN